MLNKTIAITLMASAFISSLSACGHAPMHPGYGSPYLGGNYQDPYYRSYDTGYGYNNGYSYNSYHTTKKTTPSAAR